jgi:hypothetical protein
MKRHCFFGAALAALVVYSTLTWGQQFTVQPLSGEPVVLSRADIEALPHMKVTVQVADQPVVFEGVAVQAILQKAGITFGETMKGKRLASCLLVKAADDYRVVIALPEIDPAFTDKQVILAFLRDGKSLDAKEGPYRIVIPDEKRMARWVRQVTTLKIVEVQ